MRTSVQVSLPREAPVLELLELLASQNLASELTLEQGVWEVEVTGFGQVPDRLLAEVLRRLAVYVQRHGDSLCQVNVRVGAPT